ncbi:MAG: DNA polymerase III subunit delta' [Gammaproteobacteria bacterium]
MSVTLPWLTAPWKQVAHALEADRMPAGLLIVGRAGVGRLRLANLIARALLCLEPRSDGSSCGHCAACREMDAGAHPDCLAVHLLEGKTQILVEQIRELTRGLSLTAGEKGLRCAIVSPAEKLSTTAANALLKTLEEPPAGVTLILVADSTAHLPPTIVSRCMRLPVPLPASEEALAWLAGRSERPDWPLLLALAGGAPQAAERLAEETGEDLGKRLQSLLDAAGRRSDPLTVAGGFSAWPLPRFAALVAWLAWAVLHCSLAGSTSPWTLSKAKTFGALAAQADCKRLVVAWQGAIRVAADPASLNAALAREQLVLLFVSAFDCSKGRKS